MEALGRRSLLERGTERATFTLQPVVLEYATERLVAALAQEIVAGQPVLLVEPRRGAGDQARTTCGAARSA